MIVPIRPTLARTILKHLSEERNISIDMLIEEADGDGINMADEENTREVFLKRLNDIWYLEDMITAQRMPEHLHGRYVVFVDGVPMYSRERLYMAAWLADKLCQLLPFAKEIRVLDNKISRTEICWTRDTKRVNVWIGGRA
jgi:hypothetical protein